MQTPEAHASSSKASSTGFGGTTSHSGATALTPSSAHDEASSGSSGAPASPAAAEAAAKVKAVAVADAAAPSASRASASPEAKNAAAAAGPQRKQHDGSGSGSAGDAGPKDFPVAGFSRKNTPFVCQVPGCARDLAREKEYYRRYRVCRPHAIATKVGEPGCERRYCQQCSIFHPVAEFDNEKRTCRARLQWHNSKRRKRTGDAGGGGDGRTGGITERKATRSRSNSGVLDPAVAAGVAEAGAHLLARTASGTTTGPRSAAGRSGSGALAGIPGNLAGFPAQRPGRRRSPPGSAQSGDAAGGVQSTAARGRRTSAAATLAVSTPLGSLLQGGMDATGGFGGPFPASAGSWDSAATNPGAVAAATGQRTPFQLAWEQQQMLQQQQQQQKDTLQRARPASFGSSLPASAAAAAAAGPMPPPGHAWATVPAVSQSQQLQTLQQQLQSQQQPQQQPLHFQPPAQQQPLPQQSQQPPQQQHLQHTSQQQHEVPLDAPSPSPAQPWQPEALPLLPDWQGQLAVQVGAGPLDLNPADPDAGWLQMQASAALHAPQPLSPQPQPSNPETLSLPMPPPAPPPDCQQQLAAVALRYPAVAAAAAAAWGLPWPHQQTPQPQQSWQTIGGGGGQPALQQPNIGDVSGIGGQVPTLSEWTRRRQAASVQGVVQHAAQPDGVSSASRFGSAPSAARNWGGFPDGIDPLLPEGAHWSVGSASLPLQLGYDGGLRQDMDVDMPPCLLPRGMTASTGFAASPQQAMPQLSASDTRPSDTAAAPEAVAANSARMLRARSLPEPKSGKAPAASRLTACAASALNPDPQGGQPAAQPAATAMQRSASDFSASPAPAAAAVVNPDRLSGPDALDELLPGMWL